MNLPGLSLVVKIASFVASSWFLVHLLAIFGVFVAVAYPLWWIFSPDQIPCLLCRVWREGSRCLFCRRRINKSESISPASFRSAVLNGLLILVLSSVSLGLVFAESRVLFKMGFPPVAKTVSFVIPPKGQHLLGEVFPMEIEIAGIKSAVNAVQADFSFASEVLEIVDISTKGSFADIFIQKEIDNESGFGRLTGGLPNPGFFADHGIFGTIFFRGKSPGVVRVEFLPSSMVLANDSRGTNVLKDLAAASYLILPEEVSEAEREQQEVLLQPGVLGEKTEATQMKFYDEAKVLGAKVGQAAEAKEGFSLLRTLLDLLERVDRAILSFWGKLLSLFSPDFL